MITDSIISHKVQKENAQYRIISFSSIFLQKYIIKFISVANALILHSISLLLRRQYIGL